MGGRVYSSVWLALVAFSLVAALPVTKNEVDDPVQQLEQLKLKLKDLNKNIDTYVEAEKKSQDGATEGKRHYMMLRSEKAVAPEQNDVLKQYVQSLSDDDKQLLSHMKNKAQFLQGVLMEPQQGPNPGEELVYDVKRSKTPAVIDAELQKFENELSPEDLLLLKKLKNKVQYLEGVLHEGPQAANPGEQEGLDKRSNLPSEEEDAKLQQFESELSPEEIQLLMRMKSKVKFLQGALNEEQNGPNPGEQQEVVPVFDVKRSEVSDTAATDPQLLEFENQLTPEDKVLLKKLGARVKFLQGTLHEGPQSPNPGESATQEKRSEVSAAESDPELQDFMNQLTPEDQALLEKLKTKLPLLKGAIHEGPVAANPGEEIQAVSEKRSTEKSDQDLQDFMANLSPEDLALLKHHKDKMNFLKGALAEPTGQLNPGEEVVQEKRGNPETIGQKPAPKPVGNQKPVNVNKPANQFTPEKLVKDNQHPPGPSQSANRKPAQSKEDSVEFTEADRVLLKTVAAKLEELKKSLEAFKQTYDGGAVVVGAPAQQQSRPIQQPVQQLVPNIYGQIPAQMPQQIPAQIPQQIPAQIPQQAPGKQPVQPLAPQQAIGMGTKQSAAQVPVVAIPQSDSTKNNLPAASKPKPAAKEKRYAAPVTTGRFGSILDRRVQRQFDEGWHDTPLEENLLGIVSIKKGIDEKLDIKQILRALGRAKEKTRKRRVINDDEMELDELTIR